MPPLTHTVMSRARPDSGGVQHRRVRDAVLGEHRAAHELAEPHSVLGLEDLGGDDLAAVVSTPT